MRYADVQGMMRQVLITLSGAGKPAGALLLHGTADGAILRKVKLDLKTRQGGFRFFVPALDKLAKVAKYRDQIIHWEPMKDVDGNQLNALADLYKDYTNRGNPQIIITRDDLERISNWLYWLSGDLLTLQGAITQGDSFDIETYNTFLFELTIPTAEYVAGIGSG